MQIVFTDLDGTLLDLETYDYRPAVSAVRLLQARRIPLIFCSAKTRAEQAVYRRQLAVADPFIVENGSAIFIPETYFEIDFPFQRMDPPYRIIELGRPAAGIRHILFETRRVLGLAFSVYADLPLAEICALTGLDQAAAARAANREYSETILKADLSPAQFNRLRAALAEQGLNCVSGGRFHTVTGRGSDKGRAVQLLTGLFRQQYGPVTTLGLGDSANDAPLLAAVDRPFLVQKPDGRWQALDGLAPARVEGIGPVGWRKVIFELFGGDESMSS